MYKYRPIFVNKFKIYQIIVYNLLIIKIFHFIRKIIYNFLTILVIESNCYKLRKAKSFYIGKEVKKKNQSWYE